MLPPKIAKQQPGIVNPFFFSAFRYCLLVPLSTHPPPKGPSRILRFFGAKNGWGSTPAAINACDLWCFFCPSWGSPLKFPYLPPFLWNWHTWLTDVFAGDGFFGGRGARRDRRRGATVERMVDGWKGGADDVWLDHGEMIGWLDDWWSRIIWPESYASSPL